MLEAATMLKKKPLIQKKLQTLDAAPANKTNQGADLQPILDARPASKTDQPVKLTKIRTFNQRR